MRPSDFLFATNGEGGTIVLQGKKHHNEILILGANIPVSMMSGATHQSANFVTIKAEEDKKNGMIAVVAYDCPAKTRSSNYFFLSVTYKEGKPFIDLENIWIPKKGRVGQMSYNSDHYLEISIEGVSFRNIDRDDGVSRYVKDPNILCKYLAGDIDKDEVEKAAEMVSLKEQLEKSNSSLQEASVMVASLQDENVLLEEKIEAANEKLEVIKRFARVGWGPLCFIWRDDLYDVLKIKK